MVRQPWWSWKRGRRGAAMVFIAISLAVLFGFAALAIDLGMLFVAREDAQRAADASALAGASAFLDYAPGDATPYAHERAMEYADAVRRSLPAQSSHIPIS